MGFIFRNPELIFQKVPEANQPVLSLDEALAFHGLTRTKISLEMIRWVNSIRLESPELYNVIIHDPPDIRRVMEIKMWDFCFSTGVTIDYPVRRGWNEFTSVREFIQNSLDIEERIFGYEGMEVGVWVDKLGLHITDRGPGITYEAFRIGGSDKNRYERGYFGEGLKVAMAYLLYRGCPVYVFNRKGQVFKAITPPGSTLMLIAMGRTSKPVTGTEVIIYNLPLKAPEWSDPSYTKRIIFKEWLKDPNLEVLTVKRWAKPDCPHPKPNFIVFAKDGSNIDFLWVRDIVVNKISNLTRLPSIFGYNLWWVELEPNRVSVSSIPELAKEAAIAFDKKSVEVLLDRVVKENKIKRGFFETNIIDWWYADEEAKIAAAEWVEKRNYGVTDNEKIMDWAIYMGANPLVIPPEMRSLFAHAQTVELIIARKCDERLKAAEEGAVPLEKLTLRERCNLRSAAIVMETVHIMLMGRSKKAPDIVVTEKMLDAAGTVKGEKIYIHRNELKDVEKATETLLHEYAHYYGNKMYLGAPDISETFEKALGEVAAQAAHLPIEAVFAAIRAKLGAWGAKCWVWLGTRYEKYQMLSELLEIAINEGLENMGLTGVLELTESQHYYIEFNRPLIVWVRLSKYMVDKLKEGRTVSGPDFSSLYYIYDVFDWRMPFADINLYKSMLKKELEIVEKEAEEMPWYAHIILIYNPEKDFFEVWKVIPLRQT